MNSLPATGRQFLLALVAGCLVSCAGTSRALAAASQVTNEIRIVEIQGTVEVLSRGAKTWVITQTNQVLHLYDRVRSGAKSRMPAALLEGQKALEGNAPPQRA